MGITANDTSTDSDDPPTTNYSPTFLLSANWHGHKIGSFLKEHKRWYQGLRNNSNREDLAAILDQQENKQGLEI